MARPQEFETSEALRSAMHVFWSKGYEATSLADILAATGLSKSSLYATFGDKHELFLAAFKEYQQVRLHHLKRILNNGGPFRQSIETFFRQVLERETGTDLQGSGCMTANEAVELAPHDVDVQQMVAEDFQAVEDLFTQAIIRGQTEGSIASRKSPQILAHFLVVSLQGIQVMARAKTDRARLEESVTVMLSALD
jgi:TetR/AcrR family transcriptional regulator, transcriptional repressor for nem operon